MGYLISAAAGYLLGCSNMAYYVSRMRKTDLTAAGSGNLGASNATILLGWWSGILVALHDVGKAALAVALAKLLFPGLAHGDTVAGVACVLGHIFPFWLKFRGGKGFASYMGMTLMLNWKLGLCLIAAALVVTLISDYIVCGTLTTILTVPVHAVFTRGWYSALLLAAATAVILWKHRENYPRMRNGTEFSVRGALRGKYRPQ